MNPRDDPLQLAEICLWLAQLMKNEEVAAEPRRMAREYQKRANKLKGGTMH
jgi:hypothetical protein